MYKLGINFDEISDDLDVAIRTMQDEHVAYGELRTVSGKNFVFWSDDELSRFKLQLNDSGIKLVAAATPLFKWYDDQNDSHVEHDNFGFNPYLSANEKRETIKRTIEIADRLGIQRLRIFSGLGSDENAGAKFAKSELLDYALRTAQSYGIDLYIENEPVCKVSNKQEILDLLRNNMTPNLKLWLDISNLLEVGDQIDAAFVKEIAPRLGYIHIKDYVINDREKTYVPAGQGIIDYNIIMGMIYEHKPDDIVVTVETHAKAHKVESSIASIIGVKSVFKQIGVTYE